MGLIATANKYTAGSVDVFFRFGVGIPGGIQGILRLHRLHSRHFFILHGLQTGIHIEAIHVCPTPGQGKIIKDISDQRNGNDLVFALV